MGAGLSVAAISRRTLQPLDRYAYETIPARAIIAGATKGPDDGDPTAIIQHPHSRTSYAGQVGEGASRLAIWSSEEAVIALGIFGNGSEHSEPLSLGETG